MSNTNMLEPLTPRATARHASSVGNLSHTNGRSAPRHGGDTRTRPDTGAWQYIETRPDIETQQNATRPDTEARPDNWTHVTAAQCGDTTAFGRLYTEYANVVYRYVLFRVSDHCLAEDITSETFLRALRRIASVSYQGRDLAAWFITIAKNLILDHVKSGRNRMEMPTADLADGAVGTPEAQADPEQHVLAEITQHELRHCIRMLNDDQRECIRLRFILGLSVTETAALMERNEGAIKALQHRAIRRLAQLLPDDVR